MPSLIDIRRRVRSVKNTQQITKAMKMVSAAKLRKAQERAIAARPYANILQQMLANVAEAAQSEPDADDNPLLAVRPEKRILMIVVTADSGLAGGFNANLIKLAQRFVDEHNAERTELRTGRPQGPRLFPQARREDSRRTYRPFPQCEVRRRGKDRERDYRSLRKGRNRCGVSVCATNSRA